MYGIGQDLAFDSVIVLLLLLSKKPFFQWRMLLMIFLFMRWLQLAATLFAQMITAATGAFTSTLKGQR